MKKLLLLAIGIYIIFMFSCASEKSDFAKAEKENSIQAYETFLQKYPQGEHKAKARRHIHELAFQFATQRDSLHVYKEFLKKYPESEFLTKANERIEDLTYQMAKQKDELQSYQDFLKEYPISKYLSEAKQRIDQLILESTRIEGKVFRSNNNELFLNALVFLKQKDLIKKEVLMSLSKKLGVGANTLLIAGEVNNKKNVVAETRSDKQGFYSFTKVKPGKYYLVARIETENRYTCVNNGWIISGGIFGHGEPDTPEYTRLSYLAARGENFKITAGDQLQMNIDFACK